jgi:adenylate cyclase
VARNCELTVLFSDAAGFTSYSEGVPTPKLFEDLSRYLTALTQEVLATSGTVDKYIGDALLAYWGAPVALEGAASRAVTTALHIQQRVRSMQDAGDSAGFRTRIGIVTGNVSVGAIGSQLRSDYTVIGDAVNLASRLEGANKSFDTQVLICDKTRLRLDSRFLLRTVGLARVIGHKELIRVHEVLGFGDQPAPPWLLRYEEAYRMLEANDSQSAIEELAQVLVLRNDRVIRALLDRALRARDEPDEVGEHFFDLKWK